MRKYVFLTLMIALLASLVTFATYFLSSSPYKRNRLSEDLSRSFTAISHLSEDLSWKIQKALRSRDYLNWRITTVFHPECAAIKLTRQEYLLELAEHGDPYAQVDYGFGIKDYATAMMWFKKAADQGYSSAYRAIGGLYYRGDGVEQDFEEAYFWFLLSEQPSEPNQDTYDYEFAKEKLSAQQIEKVTKRVAEYKFPQKVTSKAKGPILNIPALMCGVSDSGCRPIRECGDLLGVNCDYDTDGPYYFVSMTKKEIVGACSYFGGGCKGDHIPKEWTCGDPLEHP